MSGDGKTDASFATILLAEAEKAKAMESFEQTRLLCSPEYQHYMATFGNEAVAHFSESLAAAERDNQVLFDRLVMSIARNELPPNSEVHLRYLDDLASHRLAWRYMSLMKAKDDVERKISEYQNENRALERQVDILQREQRPSHF